MIFHKNILFSLQAIDCVWSRWTYMVVAHQDAGEGLEENLGRKSLMKKMEGIVMENRLV